MNEENTGTLSNKVALLKTFSQSDVNENTENNTNVQNTLILISTGNTLQIVTITTILMIIAFIIYTNKDNINFNKKEFYKEKVRTKIKIKKVYK